MKYLEQSQSELPKKVSSENISSLYQYFLSLVEKTYCGLTSF